MTNGSMILTIDVVTSEMWVDYVMRASWRVWGLVE